MKWFGFIVIRIQNILCLDVIYLGLKILMRKMCIWVDGKCEHTASCKSCLFIKCEMATYKTVITFETAKRISNDFNVLLKRMEQV